MSRDPDACPDCGQPWTPSLSEPRCPTCRLDIDDLEAAADLFDRLLDARHA